MNNNDSYAEIRQAVGKNPAKQQAYTLLTVPQVIPNHRLLRQTKFGAIDPVGQQVQSRAPPEPIVPVAIPTHSNYRAVEQAAKIDPVQLAT